jgi:hypothetical protein
MKTTLLLLIGLLTVSCGGSDSSTGPTVQPVSFTGVYTGTYVVASCSSGPITGFCSGNFTPGAQLPISMSLGQNSNSVSGNMSLGSFSGNFQGTASASGLTGTATLATVNLNGVSVIPNVPAWSSTLNGNAMTGSFTYTFAVAGLSGVAAVTATIQTLTR